MEANAIDYGKIVKKLKEGKTTFKSFFSTGPKDEQIKKLEVNIEKW